MIATNVKHNEQEILNTTSPIMFEWLEHEISVIKTPGFHLVDGPADAQLRETVTALRLPLPPSYQQFVLKFGNAKLYKDPETNGYKIGVFASPKHSALKDGMPIYHLGFHDGASVYVKPAFNSTALQIFEFEEDEEEKVANSFEEWLRESCANARNSYDKEAWEQILNGPRPFTMEEIDIVTARRLIHWRVLGIDANGDHIFEVKNEGQRSLPSITVGVRSKNGRLNGAVRLDISRIGPGQKEILYVSCYKGFVAPEFLDVFALPDPTPENRRYYWEFQTG